MTADGVRTYRLHVPSSYTGASAVPLVLNWHGAASNPTDQELYTGLSTKADSAGFIVIYPQGVTTAALSVAHFNAWTAPSPEPDDVAFAAAMLDLLESQLCIDTSRVFSTGFSNGGLMSVRLACSLSSRIAAIAPVAGSYYPPAALELNPSEACPDTTPVPVMAFHGTADTTVPFNGGLSDFPYTTITFSLPIDNTTPDEDVLSDWASHNGCAGARQESPVSSEVVLVQYAACSKGADVELYAVNPGGHTWPGAPNVPQLGYTTHQISATDLMWSFFVAHPMTASLSVGGVAELPDVTKLPAGTATPSGSSAAEARTFGSVVLAVAAAVIVAGWYLRRKWVG